MQKFKVTLQVGKTQQVYELLASSESEAKAMASSSARWKSAEKITVFSVEVVDSILKKLNPKETKP